jgi:hypothetical protein
MVQRWVWVANDEEAMIGAHDTGLIAWTPEMAGYVCDGHRSRQASTDRTDGRTEGLVLVQV